MSSSVQSQTVKAHRASSKRVTAETSWTRRSLQKHTNEPGAGATSAVTTSSVALYERKRPPSRPPAGSPSAKPPSDGAKAKRTDKSGKPGECRICGANHYPKDCLWRSEAQAFRDDTRFPKDGMVPCILFACNGDCPFTGEKCARIHYRRTHSNRQIPYWY